VKSNVGGIVQSNDITTGNIEFWPSNYNMGNVLNIPNARSDLFDFGDNEAGPGGGGYGSMQIHNYGASQTLFAVNNFNNSQELCIGIGNNPSGHPDWTFQSNANGYNHRRLHVFVLPSDYVDVTRPALVSASASRSLNQVSVEFNKTVSDSAATPSFFTLNNGASVTAAQLRPDKQTVILSTSTLSAGQTYTLSITGVRDRSPNANEILPGSATVFTTPPSTLPEVLANVPEASEYALIYQLAIPNTANFVPSGAPYSVDESKFPQPAFDRVAYCLELVTTTGVSNWVYVSMDAFTTDITKIGVPTAARGAVIQKDVYNMNIYAAPAASVTTGTIATGNLEFWPSDYNAYNDRNITGANNSNYDCGDSWGNASAGHGSMQVHNYLASQTILAMNHFGNNGMKPGLGIGNKPGIVGDPDWTFSENATDFSVKNLYVLSHFSTGTQPEIWSQPQSLLICSGSPALFNVYSPTGTAYQWRKNGVAIPGATKSWLEIDPSVISDAGTYDVLVYGDGTAYTVSQSAHMTVAEPGTLIRLL